MTPEEQLKALREKTARWLFNKRVYEYTSHPFPTWENDPRNIKRFAYEEAESLIREVLAASGLGWQGSELSDEEILQAVQSVSTKNEVTQAGVLKTDRAIVRAQWNSFRPIRGNNDKA